jgi:tetratricopeptide (TPR) repeat protein
LINNLSNENDRFSIFGSLYDSTTIDSEENRKFPITVIESVVTNKRDLIYDYLSAHSIYELYNYYIAKNYYYSKLFDKSLAVVEEALNIYPDGIEGLVNKSAVLGNLGTYEEAIEYNNKVINRLDPKHVNAWHNKGAALGKLGRYEEAI